MFASAYAPAYACASASALALAHANAPAAALAHANAPLRGELCSKVQRGVQR